MRAGAVETVMTRTSFSQRRPLARIAAGPIADADLMRIQQGAVRCRVRRTHAGFTYVGVMIFVAILAVVSAATLSAGSSLQRRMNEEELLFIGAQFAEAFKSYFEATPAGQRSYPAKLEELLRDPRYPGVRRHLRKIYVDPMTGRAEWGLVAAPNGIVGVHSLSEQQALKVAEFEPAFAVLSGRTHYVDWKFGFASPGVALPANVVLAGTLAPVMKPIGGKPGATKSESAPVPSAGPLAPIPSPGGSQPTFVPPTKQ